MARSESEATSPSDREIVVTRVFDAPRDLVFRMWTDPAHIVQWWGPNGFTTEIHEMDVRPGGAWRFVLHGPDGTDYDNSVIFRDVLPPECLSYWHISVPPFQTTATFVEEGNRTRLTVRMLFESTAQLELAVKRFGAVDGLNQTLARLADHLEMIQAPHPHG